MAGRRRRRTKIERADDSVETAPIGGPSKPESVDVAPIGAARPAPRPLTTPKPKVTAETKKRWGKVSRSLIDGYRLDKFMGEGSMGAVFKAEQLSLHRPVAIKVLAPSLAENDRYVKRFMREARAVAKLNHPNVVSGIDVGESQGYRYFVMEFVEGPTLAQILEKQRTLPAMAATRIVLQVAKALDHAHHAKLVHRDVKPANVVITRKAHQAKLCDLGLAKQIEAEGGDSTMEGRAVGTPDYISPEQARGQSDIDIRSDLYALGATYFHAVTGRPPFHGTTPAVVMAKHLTEEAPSVRTFVPDAPSGPVTIIARLMQKDPDDRYQTPEELIEDLDAVLDGTWEEKPLIKTRRRRARRRFR